MRLIALTFLGGVFHALILYLYYWSAIVEQATSTAQQQIILFSGSHALITIFYLAFSFFYSLIASISFPEKRVVSPYHVQIVAGSVLFIIAMVVIALLSPQQGVNIPSNSNVFLQVLLTFMLSIAYSLVISKILRWVIGYSGGEEELHKLTLSINVDYERMVEIITNPVFLATHGLEEDQDMEDENIVLLRTRRILNPRLVIVLTPESVKNLKESIISLRAYEIKYDGILKSELAEAELRNVKNDIIGIVQAPDLHPNSLIKPIVPDVDIRAAQIATDDAAKITKPKVEKLQKTHIGVMIAVVVSASIGIVLTIPLLSTEQKDFSGIAGIWITVVSTIVLLVIPLVLEEKKSRRFRKP